MKLYFLLFFSGIFCEIGAQKDRNTTPVPILKQINKHNEDGSYSYGYEAADGTFKIETKYPSGEVYGKYGYVDDTGKLREIEYGASKRGFEPNGSDIQVPPPTLKQTNARDPLGANEVEDDGQYREDPSVYYKSNKNGNNYNSYQQRQQPVYQNNDQQQFDFNLNWDHQFPQQTRPNNYVRPQNNFYQQSQPFRSNNYYQPQPQLQPQPQPQPAFRPQPSYFNPNPVQNYNNVYGNNWNPFQGHPASNVDIWTGSYSVNYRR